MGSTIGPGISVGTGADSVAPASTAAGVRGALWALHAKGATRSSPRTSAEASLRAPAVRNAGTAGLGISSTGAAGTSCTALNSGASTVLVTAARVADSETLPVTGVVALTAFAAAGGAAPVDLPPPHAPSASGLRATGAVGARRSVSDTSGSSASGATGSKWAEALNTSLHWPQRTHPSEMRNWSATTLKVVAQDGQRVIWLISEGL